MLELARGRFITDKSTPTEIEDYLINKEVAAFNYTTAMNTYERASKHHDDIISDSADNTVPLFNQIYK